MTEPTTTDAKALARFQRLVWPQRADVLRMARFLCHHEHDAEDLAQETMIKALRGLDRFTDGTDIKAWLFTILRRAHIDVVRAGARRVSTVSLDQQGVTEVADTEAGNSGGVHDPDWHDPAALLEAFSDREVIRALQKLPTEIRWTLLLVDVYEMAQAQAAQVMDVPEGTVKSRAHRGRAMLRDALYETQSGGQR